MDHYIKKRGRAVAQSVEPWTRNLEDSGSNPSEHTISTKAIPTFHPVCGHTGSYKIGQWAYPYLIPCLCGVGCKRSLVLEMEVRVSVYLIIINIIRPDIAIV